MIQPAFSPRFVTVGQRIVQPVVNHALLSIRLVGTEHVPRTGPLIVAGNHSSLLDGPLVVIETPRPVRCLTKVEMFSGPLGAFLHLVGQIPVDRSRPDRAALSASLGELERGGAVGVFPEGTRGAGDLESVQDGIAFLAVRARSPVLPVAFLGTARALPPGARRPRRSPITIVYGPPFDVPQPDNPRSRRALQEVGEGIRQRLVEHLAVARAIHGG